jgi:hypothetical protein
MKNLKTLLVIALISILCIGLQSCTAEEIKVEETQNTNLTGGKN